MTETRDEKRERLEQARKWRVYQRGENPIFIQNGYVLAFIKSAWQLLRTLPGGKTKAIEHYEGEQNNDKAPFLWAKGIIDVIQEKRTFKPWDEKKIQGRPENDSRGVHVPQSMKKAARRG
jgi:hypothetical protein